MQKTMLDRLKNISDRRRELERLLSLPETSAIPGTIKKFGREYNDLQTVATLWEDFQQVNKDLEQTKQLMEESDDSDIKNLFSLSESPKDKIQKVIGSALFGSIGACKMFKINLDFVYFVFK